MERVSLIGAGNVATHLARAFASAGYRIGQVYAPHIESAALLAGEVGAAPVDSLSGIDGESDLYIVSVKDTAVAETLEKVVSSGSGAVSKLWVHTAGSIPVDVFPQEFAHCGVLYPLQTFSKNVLVDMSQVPFFTEGRDEDSEAAIRRAAYVISDHVYHADSAGRRQLHIAGVLGCNMAMYMWALAADVLDRAGYGFEVLRPLLQATLDKACTSSPMAGMTGPARRGDLAVLEAHIADLPDNIAPVYRFVNNEILRHFGYDELK